MSDAADPGLADFNSPHYKIRAEAKRNINHSVDMMVRRHDKGNRVKEWKVDDIAGLHLTEREHKQNPDAANIPVIFVEVCPNNEYRVRYAGSVLQSASNPVRTLGSRKASSRAPSTAAALSCCPLTSPNTQDCERCVASPSKACPRSRCRPCSANREKVTRTVSSVH